MGVDIMSKTLGLLILLTICFLSSVDGRRVAASVRKPSSSSSPAGFSSGPTSYTPEERLDLLNKRMNIRTFIMTLTLKEYRELISPTSKDPRNFTVYALFYNDDTVRRRREDHFDENDVEDVPNCKLCPKALLWWKVVAASYYQSSKREEPIGPVFFVAVKILPNSKPKIHLNFAEPNMYYFPNTNPDSKAPIKVPWRLSVSEFTTVDVTPSPRGMNVFDLTEWIKDSSGISIDLRRAPNLNDDDDGNWLSAIVDMGGGLVGVIATVCYVLWRFFEVSFNPIPILKDVWEKGFLQSDDPEWRVLCRRWICIAIIWCVSGNIHNYIKGSGWAYYDSNMDMVFIGKGFRQLIGECMIVFFLYGGISFFTVRLIELEAGEEEEEKSETKTICTSKDDVPKPKHVQKMEKDNMMTLYMFLLSFCYVLLFTLAAYKNN